jgi:pseudaminic acid biosynthesis-associated methylase
MTNKKTNYQTEQEKFWAGEFGTDYIDRNKGEKLLASNLNFFNKALMNAGNISSCIEFGANIGMNLRALKLLYPEIKMKGIEINEDASNELKGLIGKANVFIESIFDYTTKETFDVSLIKGVLIHINPEKLKTVYQKLYDSTHRYILLCEYYNPSPVTIPYRGHNDHLFKRDFAGEMLDAYPNLSLVDYGFSYQRDNSFPQDDITWFLMMKGV